MVFMFPGQSSHDPTMFERLLALRAGNRQRVEEASAVLGRDLARWYRSDNADAFATNRHIQVGVFLANHLFMESLEAEGITAGFSLGLSLGEYNHLVHIGCLDFADALRLVNARGAAFDQGAEGSMASVFPIELAELEDVVARSRDSGLLEIVNLNSPQQHVISGERAAVEAACTILEREYVVDAVIIESRIPMHSSRFRPVADLLRPTLAAAPWRPSQRPYLPNVLAEIVPSPTPALLVDLLCRHVHQPVRWRASIDVLADRYPDATFVEVGPRSVLYNLLSPRWRRVHRDKTDSVGDLAAAFAATAARLRDAA